MTIRERRDRFIEEAPEGVKEWLRAHSINSSVAELFQCGECVAWVQIFPGDFMSFRWWISPGEQGYEHYRDTPSSRQAIYRGIQRIIDIKEGRVE